MTSRLQGALLIASALTLSSAFNIETGSPTIFQGEPEAYFGYRVRRFSREGIMVSAPLHREGNRTGAVYRCRFDSKKCDTILLPAVTETGNLHINAFGFSLAVDNRSPPKLMACSPSLSYACGQNTYINCICYEFDNSLRLARNLTPTFQGCPRVKLDIAILIDGSGSISESDFKVMKTFMKTVMKMFEGKDVQFSVSQFSDLTRTEFHFNEFARTSDRNQLIDRIVHMNSVTFTPSGIKHVSEQVFLEDRGARPDAARVLIVITDGESNDRSVTFEEAIAAAERKEILRYAIGVGDAFDTELATKELGVIASKPTSEFVFKVETFTGLSGLQKKLREKIFAIEGTGNASSRSSFQLELAQAGFSAVYGADSLVLGAVGAYDWAGAIVQVESANTSVVRGSPAGESDKAYLGYSVVTVLRPTGSYTAAGAPRYHHMGRVVILGRDPQTQQWAVRQTIDGQQIGSYFGAELCAVDLQSDGWTDLLLVGAPLYHETDVGGMVRVCQISPQGNFSCPSALRGQEGQTLGRFGSAISALGDLNGDGLTDVAVGAPLEDGHRGSVYIYFGTEGGIAPGYSQRIEAPPTRGDLKYFGLSIDGGADLTQDGLRDLVVGAQGAAIVLRSQPVLHLHSALTVRPAVIPLEMFHCSLWDSHRNQRLQLTVCFNMSLPTLSPEIANAVTVILNYTLSLDGGRPKSRVVFPGKGRIWERATNLTSSVGCFWHQMDITSCVVDYYRPLDLSLSYCVKTLPIPQLQGLQPALREPCVRGLTTQIPFNKNCGPDDVCVADLKLSANVTGEDTLNVHTAAQCNLMLELQNVKEIAFRPVIEVLHPQGLSFRKVTVLKTDTSVSIGCADSVVQQDHHVTNCTIAHETFAENSHVLFILTLDVSNSETWSDSIHINVSASSENEDPASLGDNVVSLDIPVRYTVNLVVKGVESSSYIEVTVGASGRRDVVHRYQVENLSGRPLPVNLTVLVRKDPSGILLWKIWDAKVEEGLSCTMSMEVRGHSGVKGHADEEHPQAGTSQVILCQLGQLARGLPMTIVLRGYVILNSTLEAQGGRARLQTEATLHFDTIRYSQYRGERDHTPFLRANVSTEVEVLMLVNYTPYIAGGAAGGFILLVCAALVFWKVGFFKRTYKDRLNETSPQPGAGQDGACTEPLNQPAPQNE